MEFPIYNSEACLDKTLDIVSQLLKKSPPSSFSFLMADFDNSSKQCAFLVLVNHAILDFVTQAAKLIIKTGKGCKQL